MLEKPWRWVYQSVRVYSRHFTSHPVALCGEDADKPSQIQIGGVEKGTTRGGRNPKKFQSSKQRGSLGLATFATKHANL
jgi:hypothetical protein